MDDFRTPFPLGFRLPRDGALHFLRQVHVFHFYGGDLDAPGFRLLIDDPLELGVDLFSFRKRSSSWLCPSTLRSVVCDIMEVA